MCVRVCIYAYTLYMFACVHVCVCVQVYMCEFLMYVYKYVEAKVAIWCLP